MNPWEILRFAAGGLSANKVRSGLTVLGILIGVAAVILLLAVGNGSSAAVKASIDKLGTNALTVSTSRPSTSNGTSAKDLTVADAKALADKAKAPHIRSVSPVVSTSGTASYQGTDHSVNSIVGTYPSYFETSNSKVAKGDYFSDDDVLLGRKVAVLGQTTAEDLFGTASPIGRTITLGGVPVRVVGVLAEKGTSGFSNGDDTVIAPLTLIQNSFTGFGALNSIMLQASSSTTTDQANAEATSILLAQHSIASPTGADFSISDQASLLSTRASTDTTFTVLLGSVAAISLLVGGIGITNIMLVTVAERTREIGIRKAIGAPRSAILGQFLAEAVLLSLTGGALGVGLGLLGARFTIAGIEPVVIPASVWGAFVIALAIGLFFGSYPANRAARLRPIDALRHE